MRVLRFKRLNYEKRRAREATYYHEQGYFTQNDVLVLKGLCSDWRSLEEGNESGWRTL